MSTVIFYCGTCNRNCWSFNQQKLQPKLLNVQTTETIQHSTNRNCWTCNRNCWSFNQQKQPKLLNVQTTETVTVERANNRNCSAFNQQKLLVIQPKLLILHVFGYRVHTLTCTSASLYYIYPSWTYMMNQQILQQKQQKQQKPTETSTFPKVRYSSTSLPNRSMSG